MLVKLFPGFKEKDLILKTDILENVHERRKLFLTISLLHYFIYSSLHVIFQQLYIMFVFPARLHACIWIRLY